MPRINNMVAHDMAIRLMRKAGFELHCVSRVTETCYYYHPSTPEKLIRVSTHRSKHSPRGINDPVSRVTFTPKDELLTETVVRNRVIAAIGLYFISDMKPSRYDGPKERLT